VIDLKTVWLTATVAATTAVVSVVGLLQPDVREALQREPGEVGEGEVWRLVTSLLVHDRWMALASNIVVLVIVGATFEREPTTSRRMWLGLYLLGGLVGQLVGLRWQPLGAGNSVAWCGLAGGLVVLALRDPADADRLAPGLTAAAAVLVVLGASEFDNTAAAALIIAGIWVLASVVVRSRMRQGDEPVPTHWLALAVLAIAAVLTAVTNIHGPPVLVAAFVAFLL
jgi:membrane associated rhomboid family serine protease